MRTIAPHANHVMQRVKVGMIGLSAVILLIGLASAVFSAANRDRGAGASAPGEIVNVAAANASDGATKEPLAELGVAPATNDNASEVAR